MKPKSPRLEEEEGEERRVRGVGARREGGVGGGGGEEALPLAVQQHQPTVSGPVQGVERWATLL